MKDRRKTVYILQHAFHEHPAVLGRALEAQGIQSRIIRLDQNESLPELQSASGLISLGGPMHANDTTNFPWIESELELMKVALERQMPIVGICLGGQILAKALGGTVVRNERMEVGWHPITQTLEGLKDPLLSPLIGNPRIFQWHEDTFLLPSEALLLAQSEACSRQAFRVNRNVYGFQFHPEADHQLVDEWTLTEGIEEDIAAIQAREGDTFVQSKEDIRRLALEFEENSLLITNGIASLFRGRNFSRAELGKITEKVTLLKSLKLPEVEVWFEGPDRAIHMKKGTIHRIVENVPVTLLIVKTPDGLLWPIRCDDVLKLESLT